MNLHLLRSAMSALAALFFLLPASASCQEPKPVWETGVGAGMLSLPDYRGSNENRFYALPYPYLIYRGDKLRVDKKSISGKIFGTDRVVLDISYYGWVPVDSDKNDARRGMPDLDATFEVGPALDIRITANRANAWALNLLLPVRPVFSTDFSSVSYEGALFSPRLNFEKADIIPGTGVSLGLSAGPMFASSGYHDYYYTVAPAYATPARPAYHADGGYSGATLTIGLGKQYKQFKLGAFVSADFLHGAAFDDSTLVQTKSSVMGGVSVTWVFFESTRTIVTDALEEIGGDEY